MTLTGPVTVRADRVAAAERAWAVAFVRLEAGGARRAELAAWIGRIRASGVVKRLAGGSAPTGWVLAAASAGREPVWLTLRQLVRTPAQWHGIDTVLVVGNPSVVAFAADTLGARCPPFVCTNGQPRAAAMVLLRSLAAAGVRLRHHGDFDWGGLAIGNFLHRRLPVEPWQFDRNSYLRAVSAHPHAAPLSGSPTSASWDAGLAGAMRETGRRIEEELVAGDLLATL